jgi:hypothetical protein
VVSVEKVMTDDTHKTNPDGRGMENLTEVLRLQAEALARISERMAGAQGHGSGGGAVLGLPPRLEPAGSHDLPVLAGDPSLSEESLPVLNAFRKFIDAERRRARIRLMWLSLAFSVLLACVLATVLYLVHSRADELQTDIQGARRQVTEVRSNTDAELKRMADAAARLTTDINRGFRVAHSNVASQIGTRDAEIDKLKETISTLEIDNAVLVGRLKEILDRTEQLQGAYMSQAQQFQTFQEAVQVPALGPGTSTNRPVAPVPVLPAIPPAYPQVQFRLPSLP